MKIQQLGSLPLASLLLTVACGAPPEPTGTTRAAETSRLGSNDDGANGGGIGGPKRNGLHINGLDENGLHINGLDENGLHINGLDENGLHINGLELEGLYVSGSQLGATMASTSQVLSGAALVGATFDITSREAGVDVSYVLRIDHVELDAGAATPDVHLYSISYHRQGDEAWQSVCTDDSGDPERRSRSRASDGTPRPAGAARRPARSRWPAGAVRSGAARAGAIAPGSRPSWSTTRPAST